MSEVIQLPLARSGPQLPRDRGIGIGEVIQLPLARSGPLVSQCTDCVGQLFFIVWDEKTSEPFLECGNCEAVMPMKVEEMGDG